jgi:protein-tyrosine phosphatase
MTPRGAITLLVDGQPVRITGGPFDSLPEGARGLCLEPASARAGEAEWRLDIPDFGVPDAAALRAVLEDMMAGMRARPDAAYHVGCRAGLGRTGLALACLAAMTGVPDPVRWLRANYDPRSVETEAQQAMVARFTAADGAPP